MATETRLNGTPHVQFRFGNQVPRVALEISSLVFWCAGAILYIVSRLSSKVSPIISYTAAP